MGLIRLNIIGYLASTLGLQFKSSSMWWEYFFLFLTKNKKGVFNLLNFFNKGVIVYEGLIHLYYIILIRLIDYYSTYSQINISLLHNDIYKKDKK